MEQLKDLLQGKLDNIQSKMEEGQNIAFVSKELRNGFTQVPNRILDNPNLLHWKLYGQRRSYQIRLCPQ